MIRNLSLALLLCASGGQALAQSQAPDGRILLVTASSGLIHVPTSLDVTQMVLFHPNETIASVVLADPTAYSVDVSSLRDTMTMRPQRPGGATIMTVQTDQRSYEFELAAQPTASVPVVVRLVDGGAAASPAPAYLQLRPRTSSRYRLSGSKALRPDSITDDGAKTYIAWSGDRPLPATFAPSTDGTEQMVDGYMRAGTYVVDRVYPELLFRIDREVARAKREEKAP